MVFSFVCLHQIFLPLLVFPYPPLSVRLSLLIFCCQVPPPVLVVTLGCLHFGVLPKVKAQSVEQLFLLVVILVVINGLLGVVLLLLILSNGRAPSPLLYSSLFCPGSRFLLLGRTFGPFDSRKNYR